MFIENVTDTILLFEKKADLGGIVSSITVPDHDLGPVEVGALNEIIKI